MTDLIAFTAYRSPRTCRNRVQLLRKLNPGAKVVCIYTGPTSHAKSFKQVFSACSAHYILPTVDTRSNWGNLDQAYARWWLEQGIHLKVERLLFLDWDVLLLEPGTRLFDQLQPGQAHFCQVFPVTDLRRDHWAREFIAANGLSSTDPYDQDKPLHRAIIFAWGCHVSDFTAVAQTVISLKGYCEMRLPYAFRHANITLHNLEPHPLPYASVSGLGQSRKALRQLQADPAQLQLAHPVYLPIASTGLTIDWLAWLLEMPFQKTLSRKIKSRLRALGLRLGLSPPLNP